MCSICIASALLIGASKSFRQRDWLEDERVFVETRRFRAPESSPGALRFSYDKGETWSSWVSSRDLRDSLRDLGADVPPALRTAAQRDAFERNDVAALERLMQRKWDQVAKE